MIVVYVLFGLLFGEAVNWMANYWPTFSANGGIWSGKKSTQPASKGRKPPNAKRLSNQSPLSLMLRVGVDVLSAGLCALAGWQWSLSWQFFSSVGVYAFLMLIALIDLKYRLVPNIIIYPALIVVLALSYDKLGLVLIGGVFAFSLFLLASWLRPGDLGGGDIKLALLLGLAFGFPQVLWALLIGIGGGGLTAIALLLTRQGGLKSRIPYAPFLCLGALIALFYNPFQLLG